MKFTIERNGTVRIPKDTLTKLRLKVGVSIEIKSLISQKGTVTNIKSAIGENGVLTIPGEIIKKLGLKVGDSIELELRGIAGGDYPDF